MHWAVVFLVLALAAALFGFGALGAAVIAKALFVLFIVLALVSLVFGWVRPSE